MSCAARMGRVISALLDEVRLGDTEHEVAGGGVDLTAAELDRVDAEVDAAHDVVGIGVALEQERVRHAGHGQVAVALPPTVAARRASFLARPHDVPHVVGEHAVLDEDVALRGMTLVVDRERSPLVRVSAVVDDGHERRGDRLAQLALEHRRVLEDVIGFEPVAARLVEQHAARALLQHDGKASRRGRHRFEKRQRPAGRAAADLFGRDRVEELEAHRPARRLVRGLHAGVARRDALHRHARTDPVVVGEQSVGVGDQDAAARDRRSPPSPT